MQNEMKEPTQEQEALSLVINLLKYATAENLRENLNKTFYAFLETDIADCVSVRKDVSGMHIEIVSFLTKLSKLNKINKHNN